MHILWLGVVTLVQNAMCSVSAPGQHRRPNYTKLSVTGESVQCISAIHRWLRDEFFASQGTNQCPTIHPPLCIVQLCAHEVAESNGAAHDCLVLLLIGGVFVVFSMAGVAT